MRMTSIHLYQYCRGKGESFFRWPGWSLCLRVNISGGWWEPLRSFPLTFFFLFSSTLSPRSSSLWRVRSFRRDVILETGFHLSSSNRPDLTENSLWYYPPFKYALTMVPFLLRDRHRRSKTVYSLQKLNPVLFWYKLTIAYTCDFNCKLC